MPLDNLDPADTFDVVETKLDATIDKINAIDVNLPGGTAGQILKKVNGTDYNYAFSDVVPSIASRTKKGVRVNSAGDYIEAVDFVDVGQSEINTPRTESTGTPHIDSEATIFTITTPNDGVTRDYHIILTSVIDASGGVEFGYNSLFKIGSTTYSANLTTVAIGDEISYTHNAVISAVPPNTSILIRDFRSALTTGTVNMSKLTYMGFAK